MTSKKSRVLIRVQPETKAALEKVAAAEQRSVSNFVEHLVTEWLRHNRKKPQKPRA